MLSWLAIGSCPFLFPIRLWTSVKYGCYMHFPLWLVFWYATYLENVVKLIKCWLLVSQMRSRWPKLPSCALKSFSVGLCVTCLFIQYVILVFSVVFGQEYNTIYMFNKLQMYLDCFINQLVSIKAKNTMWTLQSAHVFTTRQNTHMKAKFMHVNHSFMWIINYLTALKNPLISFETTVIIATSMKYVHVYYCIYVNINE